MSESDVSTLTRQLNEVMVTLGVINEKLSNYEKLCQEVTEHDRKIAEQTHRCDYVQQNKTKINWSMVITSVISSGTFAVLVWFVSKNI